MTEAIDMHALARLIGVPYVAAGRSLAGADCWGVVLLGARLIFGRDLPAYFYDAGDLIPEATALIERECKAGRWIDAPAMPPGAVHVFRILGQPTHCGLELGGGEFLHSLPGRNSCVERLSDLNWRQRRVGSYVFV